VGADKPPVAAYLDVEGILAVAKEQGVDAIHPGAPPRRLPAAPRAGGRGRRAQARARAAGYGFLSENANFARRCGEEGIAFVGPLPETIEARGPRRGPGCGAHAARRARRLQLQRAAHAPLPTLRNAAAAAGDGRQDGRAAPGGGVRRAGRAGHRVGAGGPGRGGRVCALRGPAGHPEGRHGRRRARHARGAQGCAPRAAPARQRARPASGRAPGGAHPYPAAARAAEEELEGAFATAGSEARAAFGDGRMFVEKYVEDPRHIEVQVLCDRHGNSVHLYERDCSVQRRHQKARPGAPARRPVRNRVRAASWALQARARRRWWRWRPRSAWTRPCARSCTATPCAWSSTWATATPARPPPRARPHLPRARARGRQAPPRAGTVEFMVDKRGGYYFLEVNPRIQVEHTCTEEVTGFDLVQVRRPRRRWPAPRARLPAL